MSAVAAATITPVPTTTGTRVAELDGLRGVAVAAVLVWHFVGAVLDPSLGAWTKAAYHLTILGRTGVDLFFVLSGFLITGIILERKQEPARFLGHFYGRRLLRIVPSYAVLVAIFWAVVASGVSNAAFSAETPWWRHATFTQNLWMAEQNTWGPGAISVTWSVAIEEQFYIVFPALVLLTPRRFLPRLLLAIAAGSIALRAWEWFGEGSAFGMYVHTLSRLDGLAAGALVAWAWHDPAIAQRLHAQRDRIVGWLRRLAWLFPLLAFGVAWNLAPTMAAWGHTYLAVFYAVALLAVLCSLGRAPCGWLRHPLLRGLGALSYTVYLFHPLMLSVVFLLAGRPEKVSSPADAVLALLALALTLAWATASLRWMERPLLAWGRRWSY